MSQMKLLESIDSGSNYSFGDKMEYGNTPRSVFSLSHRNTLTIKNAGQVVPIGVLETLPNDDFDININALIRVMPQVVPMYSRQRLYIYAFYSRCYDLWNGWDVFAKKGYSGNVVKQIPQLDSSNCIETSSKKVEADSFADYLGFPIGAITSDSTQGHENYGLLNAGLNAMIPFMALKVWRDYFMNKNHFINDRIILPDDDSRFRLGDDGNLLSAKDAGKQLFFDLFGDWNDVHYDNSGNLVFSGFYHDYPDDRFTSALPFTQRGDTPTLPVEGHLDWSKIVGTDSKTDINLKYLAIGNDGKIYSPDSLIGYETQYLSGLGIASGINNSIQPPIKPLSATPFSSVSSGQGFGNYVKNLDIFNKLQPEGFTITLNQIRELAIKQTELEKMARTDGSYSQFGLTFFGEKSKSANDYRPLYIGGTYKNIVFTEVLQTSGSSVGTTDPNSSSPLGAYAGHGITGIQNGRIGHLHSDDFGFIMFFACIMPDVYYSQGLDKMFTKSLQSDLYLPERAKLGLIPILNKELYYSGNNGNEQGDDNYLWAYNNPFDEYRYKANEIHGKIADPNNLSFFPYTQSRKFTQLPNWGREFAEANNVRKDSFFAPSEDAYSGDFYFDIRAVRPLPYKPIPAKIV